MSSPVMLLASVGRDAKTSDASSSVRVYVPESARASLASSSTSTDDSGEPLCARWSPTNGALCVGTKGRGSALMKPDLKPLGCVPEDANDIGEVRAIDFSAGSRYLAVGGTSAGEEVSVWDLKRKRKHRVFAGHERSATTVKYGMFGRVVGSGGGTGQVLVHDVESGAMKLKLAAPTTSGVTSIDFSKFSPQHLVSACTDGTVRLWDTEVGELQSTLTVRGSECYQVEFSPTAPGLVAYCKSDGRVVLQDTTSPTPSGALTFRSTQATCLAWHHSGFALAVGTSDGRVSWLDTRKISGGADVATCTLYDVRAHEGGVHSLSWQQPVPHAFQVETTPARGGVAPDSPMTPVGEKSARLLQQEHTPPVAALARDELKLITAKSSKEASSRVDSGDIAALLDAAVEKLGGDLSARIRDVHVELLRQHQLQQEEATRMFDDMQQTQLEMAAEIASLRAQLERRM
ncbi:WD40/YVTN repeat-like-containing domain [Ostreococcus tauri]|uniref:WD40/YVTN repeat-like-containing domain n=2 Tax=Ostreococcus tauri TaxID=70448 RepID=A0A090M5X9_OSTTA|nr:WD40/YVTN repeat-like-containing domain [Ostreococcus tauri]CEF97509.1 WD40/YVTN repeat-like-containing domain [Ostreococcus tauri]|eukprot:XP_003078685.2 WD40/YVTN repeat-like-containing domain [Ostreococcus tauri]